MDVLMLLGYLSESPGSQNSIVALPRLRVQPNPIMTSCLVRRYGTVLGRYGRARPH